LDASDDTEWTVELIRALDEFRRFHQDITANHIITFLHIAAKEGMTQKELERATGLQSGTISRICAILSDRGLRKRGAEALDLIRMDASPLDYRVRVQSLSPNGRRLLERLRTIFR